MTPSHNNRREEEFPRTWHTERYLDFRPTWPTSHQTFCLRIFPTLLLNDKLAASPASLLPRWSEEPLDSKWHPDNFQWGDCVGTVEYLDAFLQSDRSWMS